MDSIDANKILAILTAAYPMSYRNATEDDVDAAVGLWETMFAEEPYPLVEAAVKALIATRTSTFPPVIGEVKEKLEMLRAPVGMTGMEAWALVSKAVFKTDFAEPSKQFDKLPSEIQRVVGFPKQLADWGLIDEETLQTVVASNFMRSFDAYKRREKELAMLPGEVRAVITGLSERLSLDRANGNLKALPKDKDQRDDED